MDKQLRQFWADAKKIAMTAEERSEVRQALFSDIKKRPVAHFAADAKQALLSDIEKSEGKQALLEFMRTHRTPRSRWDWHLLFARKLTAVMSSFAILAVAGSGAAYAAEDTVPGDVLYLVKIHVTEPLRERMRFDPEAKARWAQNRISRRMHEAEVLMQRGSPPEEALQALEERMEMHSAHLQEQMDSLPGDVPEELRARLQERFEKHEKFLSAFQAGEIDSEEAENRIRRHHERMKTFKQRRGRIFPSERRPTDSASDRLRVRPDVRIHEILGPPKHRMPDDSQEVTPRPTRDIPTVTDEGTLDMPSDFIRPPRRRPDLRPEQGAPDRNGDLSNDSLLPRPAVNADERNASDFLPRPRLRDLPSSTLPDVRGSLHPVRPVRQESRPSQSRESAKFLEERRSPPSMETNRMPADSRSSDLRP